jgi:hypothetical protein
VLEHRVSRRRGRQEKELLVVVLVALGSRLRPPIAHDSQHDDHDHHDKAHTGYQTLAADSTRLRFAPL